MTPSYFRIGGLMMDLPAGFENRCKQFLDNFFGGRRVSRSGGNKIFQKTQGHRTISAEDAIDWGLSGPCLRGSGVNLDIRRANPYRGYENYDFEVPMSLTETFGRVTWCACAR